MTLPHDRLIGTVPAGKFQQLMFPTAVVKGNFYGRVVTQVHLAGKTIETIFWRMLYVITNFTLATDTFLIRQLKIEIANEKNAAVKTALLNLYHHFSQNIKVQSSHLKLKDLEFEAWKNKNGNGSFDSYLMDVASGKSSTDVKANTSKLLNSFYQDIAGPRPDTVLIQLKNANPLESLQAEEEQIPANKFERVRDSKVDFDAFLHAIKGRYINCLKSLSRSEIEELLNCEFIKKVNQAYTGGTSPIFSRPVFESVLESSSLSPLKNQILDACQIDEETVSKLIRKGITEEQAKSLLNLKMLQLFCVLSQAALKPTASVFLTRGVIASSENKTFILGQKLDSITYAGRFAIKGNDKNKVLIRDAATMDIVFRVPKISCSQKEKNVSEIAISNLQFNEQTAYSTLNEITSRLV